ncbi:ABC transporter substrate-binding protein [Pinirhizobacter soli]|uniref:ABC transporter substrate-binding protein n=1 Tax=Pinirhizobacter soli TaxID=2786953 RepID=UPI002029BE50|nr:ABC transporter substrate-binding protein [Pinirhizobacter soli]
MSESGALRTVLATSPLTEPLKSGAVASPGLTFDFVDVSPVHKAFAPMVRQQSYDVSELAIVTALQAVAYGRPIILLPAVVASRFQRGCLITRRSGGVASPQDLPGKRIGVRAYTQTTGMWVRAHLAEDYGLATLSMHWLTHDPAHVEQYEDPFFVEHAADDKSLLDQLREGITDAAILGNDLPKDEEFVPVIANASEKDSAWHARHGFVPINHLVSVSAAACKRDPGAVREAYGLLLQSFARLPTTDGKPSPYAFGFSSLLEPVQYVIDACLEQGLLPRRLGIDEVFGPAETILGGLPA